MNTVTATLFQVVQMKLDLLWVHAETIKTPANFTSKTLWVTSLYKGQQTFHHLNNKKLTKFIDGFWIKINCLDAYVLKILFIPNKNSTKNVYCESNFPISIYKFLSEYSQLDKWLSQGVNR